MRHSPGIGELARTRFALGAVLAGLAGTLAGCGSGAVHVATAAHTSGVPPALDNPAPAPEPPTEVAIGPSVVGIASWYRRGPDLQRTCTGEPLLDNRLSAASPVLPMGTEVRVRFVNEDRSVVVRVNDCMPRGRRVIDLSEAAARELGMLGRGTAMVRVTPVAWQ